MPLTQEGLCMYLLWPASSCVFLGDIDKPNLPKPPTHIRKGRRGFCSEQSCLEKDYRIAVKSTGSGVSILGLPQLS